MSLYVTLCHFMSLYVTLCHFMSLYVTLCHFMSLYVTLTFDQPAIKTYQNISNPGRSMFINFSHVRDSQQRNTTRSIPQNSFHQNFQRQEWHVNLVLAVSDRRVKLKTHCCRMLPKCRFQVTFVHFDLLAIVFFQDLLCSQAKWTGGEREHHNPRFGFA